MRRQELEDWLRNRIAAEIDLNVNQVDASAPLIGYLMNGFQSFSVVRDLEKVAGTSLPEAILYAKPTITELADHVYRFTVKKRPGNALSRRPLLEW